MAVARAGPPDPLYWVRRRLACPEVGTGALFTESILAWISGTKFGGDTRPTEMPTLAQGRGAFGSGSRSLGPPTPVRNPLPTSTHGGGHPRPPMALHDAVNRPDPIGGGRFAKPSSSSLSSAPAPSANAPSNAPASSAPSYAPAPSADAGADWWRSSFKSGGKP